MYLGFAVIGLLFAHGKEVWNRMSPFLRFEGFVESIAQALAVYSSTGNYDTQEVVSLRMRLVVHNDFSFFLPEDGKIPSDVIKHFLHSGWITPAPVATMTGYDMDFRLVKKQ